ncbi:hypothetical protein ABPG72_003438 [Tetrahymena utriculariae]
MTKNVISKLLLSQIKKQTIGEFLIVSNNCKNISYYYLIFSYRGSNRKQLLAFIDQLQTDKINSHTLQSSIEYHESSSKFKIDKIIGIHSKNTTISIEYKYKNIAQKLIHKNLI